LSRRIVLAVHGGAGRLAAYRVRHPGRRAYEQGLARALRAGQTILLRGGRAERAAIEAVRVLEDDERFNAGRGAALCADGSVELSAAVMSGHTLRVGAMVGLKRTKNPILAARALMEHTHGFLYGAAGDAYAERAGLEMVAPDYFRTPFRTRQWQQLRGSSRVVLDHSTDGAAEGTVGAVALDRRGRLAAATSTGGLVNQLPGRIGDSPVIGAGTWADGRCAVSATGKGDAFARIAFARRLADRIELAGEFPEVAAAAVLGELSRVRGRGGCILVDAAGRLALPFNSPQMLRGWVVGDEAPVVAILPGETVTIEDETARVPRRGRRPAR
jgi:beta-aspartyl-peptidase (threonine type)